LQSEECNLNVNGSDFWDEYDTANSTWFENIAGALSIKLSELTSFIDTWFTEQSTDDLAEGSTNLYDNQSWNETWADDVYVNVDGDTMTGELDMEANGILFGGTTIKNLTEKNSNIEGPALGIYQTGPSGQNLPHLILQSGGDSQSSVLLRSLLIANEIEGFHNTSDATDCVAYMAEIGEELKIDCNTTTTGADLLVSDDFQAVGDAWFKDEDAEQHNMNRMLSHNDALQDDTVLDSIEILTTNNGTHTIVFLNSTNAHDIEVNFDQEILSFESPIVNVTLTNGVNSSPQINYIVITNGGAPILQALSAHPGIGVEAIDIATYYIGENGVIQAFTPTTQQLYESIHGASKRAKVSGALYVIGYDDDTSATEFNLTSGNSLIIYDIVMCQNMTMADDGFFFINSTGDWVYATDLSAITQYSDGTTIGASKFVPLVVGAIPTSRTSCQLVYVLPSNPGAEYISCRQAEEDSKSVRNVFPPNTVIKEQYTATTWVLMDASDDEFCQFQNGDYSRKIAGDVTGGGGAPTSPTTDHSALDNLDYVSSGHIGFLSDLYNSLSNFTNDLGIGNWSDDKGDYSTTSEAGDLYRAQSWDNFTGIPHATPSDGDVTHFSWADEIYDWAVGLFLQDVVDDTAPQLGGYLDTDGNNIGATDDEIENIYVGTNTRIYFGDGQEGSMYHNGTNLIISG
jgi:hypothetical protein